MVSKPKGYLETPHLFEMNENPTDQMWGSFGELYHFRVDAVWIDDRTGEIFCELLGSLAEI